MKQCGLYKSCVKSVMEVKGWIGWSSLDKRNVEMLGQISSLGHKVDITIVLHNQGDGCFLEATAYSKAKGSKGAL